jgi:hypothetical protein
VLLNGRVRVLACVYWGVRSWRAAVRHALFAAEAMVGERGWNIILAGLSAFRWYFGMAMLKVETWNGRSSAWGFPEHAARESTTFLLGFDTIICYDSLGDELLAWKDMITGTGRYGIPMWTRGNGLPAWTE